MWEIEVDAKRAGNGYSAHARRLSRCLMAAMATLVLTPMAFGQSYLSTINGTVTDPSGAVVVGAQVRVVDDNTHFTSSAVTNHDGLYSVPFLTPDTYDVTVDARGFAQAEQTGVVLVASGVKQVNIKLAPAGTSATVTVISDQQLLDTESAAVGSTITANELHNAPLIDSNVYMMATRVAGVYSNFTQNGESTQWWPVGGGVSGTEVGNGLGNYALITMNGIVTDLPEGGPGDYTGYVPPAIAVQELKVETSPYDAEVGRTLGGTENTVLKTGTQKLHAEASFLYGDTIFNSNTSQRTAQGLPRTADIWSQPSFVATGPVIIPRLYHPANPKTFFMVSYEHIQYAIFTQTAFTGNVPTVKELKGDFSELSTAANPTNNPAILTGLIFDPTTTVPAGAPGTYATWCKPSCAPGQRESFNQEYNEGPGANFIPSSRFNATGVNLLKYWPTPTAANESATKPGQGNFLPATGLSSPDWMWMAAFSIEHEFNENNKLTVAYLPYVWNAGAANQDFPYVNGYSGGPGYPKTSRKQFGGLIDYTTTLSPTMVLDLRSGGFYHPFTIPRPGDNIDLSKLGFTGATLSFPHPNFPAVAASGPFGSYTSLNSGASYYEYSSLADNSAILSKSFQRHSLKTGFNFDVYRTDPQGPVSSFSGSSPITFNTTFTNSNPSSGSAASNGGDGVAALLLGYPSSGTANIVPSPAYEWIYWAGFVQDDWRITNKLTLNLGFRWDYMSPITERHNMLEAGFDFSSSQPFNLPNSTGTTIASSNVPPASLSLPQGYHGGLSFVNTSSYPSRQYFYRELGDRWQPRLGAAWHVFPNTVLRGGYAVYFAMNYPSVQNNGFSSNTSINASTNSNFTPATCTSAQGADAYGFCNISNPYPNGYVSPTGTLLGLSTGIGGPITFNGPAWAPYKNNVWSVGIEQQLPLQMMVDIEYSGNDISGVGVGKNWNALPNCYYYGGGCSNAGNATALGTPVTNPMAGYLPASSSLNAAKIPQSDLYLPYPEFTTITQSNITKINGTGQRLGKRLDNALYATVTKRTSHGLEFRVAATYEHVEDMATLLNAGDPVTSLIKFDDSQPNRYLVGDLVYDLPKLNVNHALGYVVNGWRWSHSLNWQAGTSIGVPAGAFSTGISPVTHHQSLTHWFNTCYIPVVANVGQTYNGVVQTSPVYGPPTNCQYGEQPAWIQQPTATLNQLNGNPMRGVRLQEVPYYDMALLKEIPVREGYSLSVRAEFHNVLNKVLYGGGPNTSLTASTFGQNSPATTVNGIPNYGQFNDPRIIRFEARLSF
jgi:hypothetical protein